MPELMHPYHTEVIADKIRNAGVDVSSVEIDNALQAVIENQTEIDGARPNLENAMVWDEIEYLVVDRLFPQDADLVLAP